MLKTSELCLISVYVARTCGRLNELCSGSFGNIAQTMHLRHESWL